MQQKITIYISWNSIALLTVYPIWTSPLSFFPHASHLERVLRCNFRLFSGVWHDCWKCSVGCWHPWNHHSKFNCALACIRFERSWLALALFTFLVLLLTKWEVAIPKRIICALRFSLSPSFPTRILSTVLSKFSQENLLFAFSLEEYGWVVWEPLTVIVMHTAKYAQAGGRVCLYVPKHTRKIYMLLLYIKWIMYVCRSNVIYEFVVFEIMPDTWQSCSAAAERKKTHSDKFQIYSFRKCKECYSM